MKNNNKAVISKIAKRSYRVNKKRNFFIILTIILTTFMITSVFGIGFSFMSAAEKELIRLSGTAAHAVLVNPAKNELEKLKQLPSIDTIGTSTHIADIVNTVEMGNMSLSLTYNDSENWLKMSKPALTDLHGTYPQSENEIMIPLWILEKLNIKPKIGMEIPFTYTINQNGRTTEFEKTFTLSGWFNSYAHIRNINTDTLLVSEAMSRLHNRTASQYGIAGIMFKNSQHVRKSCDRLTEDLSLKNKERISISPAYNRSSDTTVPTIAGLLIVSLFVVFAGYLLIYNVLQISVSRDIRFYGLLKTIGTTPKQIRRIVTFQIIRLSTIGILLGIISATILSLYIVPLSMRFYNWYAYSDESVVSFSPYIYIGAAVFSLLTTIVSTVKPAKMASRISPIDAQKYTGLDTCKKSTRFSSHGKAYRMAFRNIFRERKRALFVLLSLFFGLTIFMIITTIVSSMNTENFVRSYIDFDFTLENQTVNSENEEELFNDAFLEKISTFPGLQSMHFDTLTMLDVACTGDMKPYTQDFIAKYPDFLGENETAESVKSLPCVAIGVDGETLAEEISNLDIEAFEAGEFMLIAARNGELYFNTSLLEDVQSLEILSSNDKKISSVVPVSGMISARFHNHFMSAMPTLVMSHSLLEQFDKQAKRAKVFLNVEDDAEAQFLQSIRSLTDNEPNIARESREETRDMLQNAKMLLYLMGGSVTLILGLIGTLNFINVMSVSVMSRKREFATLESIGMTAGQIRSMLIFEGASYLAITLVLVSTIGTGITYGLFKLFQQEADYAIFTYPIIPILTVALLITAACLVSPIVAYRSLRKTTIVERLREAE